MLSQLIHSCNHLSDTRPFGQRPVVQRKHRDGLIKFFLRYLNFLSFIDPDKDILFA